MEIPGLGVALDVPVPGLGQLVTSTSLPPAPAAAPPEAPQEAEAPAAAEAPEVKQEPEQQQEEQAEPPSAAAAANGESTAPEEVKVEPAPEEKPAAAAPSGNKRTAEEAGLDAEPAAPPSKHARQEALDAMDSSVRTKLQAVFASGKIEEDDLDAGVLRELADLAPEVAVQALEQLEQRDLSGVRNKTGYFAGVMTRLRRQQVGPKLHPDLQHRLDGMFRVRKIKADDLDVKVYEHLHSAPIPISIQVLDKFAQRDLTDIRNLSAFVITMLRTAEKSAPPHLYGPPPPDPYYPPPRGGYSGGYSGGPPPPHHYHSPPHDPYPRGPPPPYRGAPPPHHHSSYDPYDPYPPPRGAPPPHHHHYAPPPAPYAPPPYAGEPPGPPGPGAGRVPRQHRAAEQAALGVRVEEFHGLADTAVYVPGQVALRLQHLWDSGVKLVSLLDDRSWEALADLSTGDGLAAVDEVAAAMDKPGGLRNVNAYFMTITARLMGRGPPDRGGPPRSRGGPPPPAPAWGPPSGGYSGSYGAPSGGPGGRDPRGGGGGPPPRGGGPPGGGPVHISQPGVSAMHQLPPAVKAKAESAIAAATPYLNAGHFDEGVVHSLVRLGEYEALAVLDEVMLNDLGTVRNIPAYIMGICKRHRV